MNLDNTAPVVTIICGEGNLLCGWIEPAVFDGWEGIVLHHLDPDLGIGAWVGWSAEHWLPPREIGPSTFVMDRADGSPGPQPINNRAYHARRWN